MRRSLLADPLSPVLLEPHLAALDRRVALVLQVVRECVNSRGSAHPEQVIILKEIILYIYDRITPIMDLLLIGSYTRLSIKYSNKVIILAG